MRRKIPSTQALACFEAAARHESYTRAAQELSLTQSAVSRQITALEDFLGVPLFRRTRHGVALTPSGLGYWRQVSRRLQGLERDTLDVMTRRGLGGALALAAVHLCHPLADSASAAAGRAAPRHRGAHRHPHPPVFVWRHRI